MSSYCTNCGSPVSGSFCGNCGQRVKVTPSAAAPVSAVPPAAAVPPGQPASAAPAKSSGLGKVLLIGGAIILLFLVVGAAGSIYAVYWFKNKAMQKVSTYTGVRVGAPSETKVAKGNACSLLSRDDVQQILNITIEKTSEIMEGSEPGCAYYTDSAGFAELRNLAAEQARKQAEEAQKQPDANTKSDNPLSLLKNTNQLEGVVKALALTQGGDQEGRAFAFTVDRNFGRNNWMALRTTTAIVPGFKELQGVGDRAMLGSFGHALYVLKGDSMVALELTWVPDAPTKGADIARKIASHL